MARNTSNHPAAEKHMSRGRADFDVEAHYVSIATVLRCKILVGPSWNFNAIPAIRHIVWERAVPHHGRYTTTVVGTHSVPDWCEALDRLLAVGQLSMGALADAQNRCARAAILDQELAGIDVITGGKMHRRTHNRHSPPNAMFNYFWQKIPGVAFGRLQARSAAKCLLGG